MLYISVMQLGEHFKAFCVITGNFNVLDIPIEIYQATEHLGYWTFRLLTINFIIFQNDSETNTTRNEWSISLNEW